jgi:hypothetical protein
VDAGDYHRKMQFWYLILIGAGIVTIIVAFILRKSIFASPVIRVVVFSLVVLPPYCLGTWQWWLRERAVRQGELGSYRRPLHGSSRVVAIIFSVIIAVVTLVYIARGGR